MKILLWRMILELAIIILTCNILQICVEQNFEMVLLVIQSGVQVIKKCELFYGIWNVIYKHHAMLATLK
jgi:hypothetical protein